ncbi:hypothetical protein HOE425_330220 [Hoeflea sp. EC-HK425]|nr:hypothetical protein HOE425_330220 [Hoeflea sp. EC-HK425]
MQRLQDRTMLPGKASRMLVGGQGFGGWFGVLRKAKGDRASLSQRRLYGRVVACMRGPGEKPKSEKKQRALIVFVENMQTVAVKRCPKHRGIKTRLAGIELNNRPARMCGGLFSIGKMKVEEGPELEQGDCLSEPALSLARHDESGEQTARDSQTNQRCQQPRHARPPSCPPDHEGFSHDPGGCSRRQA